MCLADSGSLCPAFLTEEIHTIVMIRLELVLALFHLVVCLNSIRLHTCWISCSAGPVYDFASLQSCLLLLHLWSEFSGKVRHRAHYTELKASNVINMMVLIFKKRPTFFHPPLTQNIRTV